MTRNTRLNDTQLVILSTAAGRDDRMALPLAKSLALDEATTQRAIKALLKRNLIEEAQAALDAPSWRTTDDGPVGLVITEAGLKAIGLDKLVTGGAADSVRSSGKGQHSKRPGKAPRAARRNPGNSVGARTKADTVIALLGRKNGATVPNLIDATGWQPHSIRGFISGTLKKRMGLTVTSDKPANGERRYRIEPKS